jgi:hypothetical protein
MISSWAHTDRLVVGFKAICLFVPSAISFRLEIIGLSVLHWHESYQFCSAYCRRRVAIHECAHGVTGLRSFVPLPRSCTHPFVLWRCGRDWAVAR